MCAGSATFGRSCAEMTLPLLSGLFPRGPKQLEQRVDLVHGAAGDVERRVVLADRLLVGALEQAVHVPGLVVVELELGDAERIAFLVTCTACELVDRRLRQLQIVVVVHVARHLSPLTGLGTGKMHQRCVICPESAAATSAA